MKYSFLLAKYIPNAIRLEPNNVGILVVGLDDTFDAKFCPKTSQTGRTHDLWVSYWRNALNNKKFRKRVVSNTITTQGVFDLKIITELSCDTYWLTVGGWDMPAYNTTVNKVTNRLYDRLVRIQKNNKFCLT